MHAALSKGEKTTFSPEEIRHLAFSRRGRGYAPDEVDRVLADVADSFEAVWNDRTRLYEEVLKLREQLRDNGDAAAALHAQIERIETEREKVVAELAEYHSSEQTQSEVQQERDRLLEEIRGGRAASAEQRKGLLEFLLDALRQVGPLPGNGSHASAETGTQQLAQGEPEEVSGRTEDS